ncbi:hypothetical protein ABIE66_000744 [Peribacillus sp. B2I2]
MRTTINGSVGCLVHYGAGSNRQTITFGTLDKHNV